MKCASLTQPMFTLNNTVRVMLFLKITECPTCSGVKVCVVDGGSATCECPSGYVDDGSGGCTSVPGMFTL